MTLILQEPGFIRQEKANSCWFACLKMLLEWHCGSRSVGDQRVSDLASWTTPRSYSEIPADYRDSRNIEYVDRLFASAGEIEQVLQRRGPFVGGGAVGKFFIGKRLFGHAILIYGVNAQHDILHHDPTLGPRQEIKWTSYQTQQDGERLQMKEGCGRVVIGP